MNDKTIYIWDGIFDCFPEEENNFVWDSEQWVNSLAEGIILPDVNEPDEEKNISQLSLVHEYPLPPVVALLAEKKDHLPIRVLDFGGGMGNSFIACMKSLPNPNCLEFHIVEAKKVCEKGRAVYSKFNNLFFHDELPVDKNSFDIVHVAASLHYIRDWRAVLKQLSNYNPQIMMLSALNAGDIKTFVSSQNYYGHKIPVWFWNINEILDYMRTLGYRLIYKSLLEFSFLGKYQPLPMENFPPEYRLKRKCNLMFAPTDNK